MVGSRASLLVFGVVTTLADSDQFQASCNDDSTLDVFIPFDREAEVLDLQYGDCNKDSAGVSGLTQNADFNFNITLDLVRCGMDDNLRAIELAQSATMRIGRNSTDIVGLNAQELTFADFVLDAYCSVTDTYEVVFDYGTLQVQKSNLTDGLDGEVELTFAITSMDSNFENETQAGSIAGELVYLAMTVESPFNYAKREFAPESCTIFDTVNGFSYTMFHAGHQSGCENEDVELVLDYDEDKKAWQMTHVLFLLGDFDESTFQLKCTMKVCEIDDADSACDQIRRECNITLETTTLETLASSGDVTVTYSAFAVSTEGTYDEIIGSIIERSVSSRIGNAVITVDEPVKSNQTGGGIESVFTVHAQSNGSRRRRRAVSDLPGLLADKQFLLSLQDEIRAEYANQSVEVSLEVHVVMCDDGYVLNTETFNCDEVVAEPDCVPNPDWSHYNYYVYETPVLLNCEETYNVVIEKVEYIKHLGRDACHADYFGGWYYYVPEYGHWRDECCPQNYAQSEPCGFHLDQNRAQPASANWKPENQGQKKKKKLKNKKNED